MLSADDPVQAQASVILRRLEGTRLVTHNYAVLECAALVQRRLGRVATVAFFGDLLAPVEIVWVDESIHRAAAAAFLQAGAAGPSLVDCASFEVMRLRGIRTAFAFDRHFEDAGFELVG